MSVFLQIAVTLFFPPVYPAKAQVYEKVSLQGIQQLVHRSYQTLALWKLLCDHQFSLIMCELPKVRVCTDLSSCSSSRPPERRVVCCRETM